MRGFFMRGRLAPLRDDQTGFTLIEVTVALILFSLTGVLFVGALTLGLGAAGAARQAGTASEITRAQIESIKYQDYVEPISYATVTVPDSDFVIAIGGTILKPGILQQIDVTVTYPEGELTLSGYKTNQFPPVLADFPLGEPDPECPVGKVCPVYYLHNNPSPPTGDTDAQVDLPMDETSFPAFISYNYDADRDVSTTGPGLSIRKGASGPGETDLRKYQNWRTGSLGGGLAIDGDVTLHLWAAPDEFQQNRRGAFTAYLRDYDPTGGGSYTEIASASTVKQDWQEGFEDFVIDVIQFPNVSYSIPGGHRLELKLTVGDSTQTPLMWVMYDFIDFQSKLFLTATP